jgi:hypothetical protein
LDSGLEPGEPRGGRAHPEKIAAYNERRRAEYGAQREAEYQARRKALNKRLREQARRNHERDEERRKGAAQLPLDLADSLSWS